jgi:hypothetical protein
VDVDGGYPRAADLGGGGEFHKDGSKIGRLVEGGSYRATQLRVWGTSGRWRCSTWTRGSRLRPLAQPKWWSWLASAQCLLAPTVCVMKEDNKKERGKVEKERLTGGPHV